MPVRRTGSLERGSPSGSPKLPFLPSSDDKAGVNLRSLRGHIPAPATIVLIVKRLALILVVALCAAQTGGSPEERLWHYRNLGKAYYENPTDQAKAVDVFRKA